MPRLFRSKNEKKKYSFLYDDETASKGYRILHFGAAGYGDYPYYYKTKGKAFADKKKKSYLARHSSEDWNSVNPGSLSRWILWNKPTISESYNDFLKRFNL